MAQFLLSNARKIILVNKQSQQINIARTILNNNSHNRRDVVRQALIKRSFFSTPFHFESHTMNVPSMGDSITEGTMVEWLKDVGDYAAEDEVIAIVETDKVSVDIRAPVSGTITEIMAALDTNVEVQLEDFVLINTPGTLKLLSLPSFSGLSSLINNETGIEFAYGKISFRRM